jgi:hypothetical protein
MKGGKPKPKRLVMEGGKSRTETEVFRAFRLGNFGAQRLNNGELWAVFQHIADKMVAGDQSAVVIGQFRHQADLLEAMLPPRAKRPDPPEYSWRRNFIGPSATAKPKDIAAEVFNVIRLTDIEAQGLSDGKVQGVFQRMIVEMAARGKAAVVIEYLRRRAGFLETIPERMAAPRTKKRSYLRCLVGAPQNNMWDRDEPKPEGRAKDMAADKSLKLIIAEPRRFGVMQHDVADEAPFGGEDDTTPGEWPDRKYEDEKTADAVAEATEWQARRDEEDKKEIEDLESGSWPLVLDGQTNADGGEDG